MNCSNCGTKLTCGCQKRSASDGKSTCSNCITSYENNLKILKSKMPNNGIMSPKK